MSVAEGGPVAVHRECKVGACEYAGFDEDGATTVEVGGREITFPGCPVKHLDMAEVSMWLAMHRWLAEWNQTPADFGVPLERLDPRYWDAMMLIDSTLKDIRRENKP